MVYGMKDLALLMALMAGCCSLRGQVPATPLATNASTAAANTQPADGPKLQFDNVVHDFGKIGASEQAKHTFYFTNTGNQALYITNVHPSCGCTAAGEWTRMVEPGQFGAIPIQFNASSFNGMVLKAVTVTSNDRQQPSALLQIKAQVWRPIEVTPQYAIINIGPDSRGGTNIVRIINNTDQPLTLSDPESSNPSFVPTIVEVKTNLPGKEFQLIIAAVPPLPPGSTQAQIKIASSSTNMPVLNVTALAFVQPPVSLMPAQIGLPPGPLANQLTSSITIVNNTTNWMTVAEPSINATNVTVQLREMQPGRTFVVTLGFPEGFVVSPGEQIALTAKSDHPRMPNIRIPIFQTQRQAAVQPPAKPASAAGLIPSATLPPAPSSHN
jgi:hypothetical protein